MLKKTTPLALAAMIAGAPAVTAEDLWLHVRVVEDQGAKVSVNLPIGMIEAALPMLEQHGADAGRIQVEDWEMSAAELRRFWQEAAAAPDMTFVVVEDEGETVRVWKEAGYLRVSVIESGEGADTVNVRIPGAVVDALLSGEGEELNLEAGLQALADSGVGEIVSVDSDGESVRVWIDRSAEAG